MTAAERYKWACETPSDIALLVPALWHHGVQCERITEFGVRGGVSTSAWLYSIPKVLRLYDWASPGCLAELEVIAKENGTELTFKQADTTTVKIEETDLLFIDTTHNAECLIKELQNNADAVTKYILMHDTEFNREKGEGGGRGLQVAIDEFLGSHPEWMLHRHYVESNGLTVLRRRFEKGGVCSAQS